ncbi:MAG: carboxypeptidase-like regulatory domain-containing protein [Bryobacteraceae bacterium]
MTALAAVPPLALLFLAVGMVGAAQESQARRVVRGVVLDPSGAPIAGAEVHLARPDSHHEPDVAANALSDRAGAFRLETTAVGKFVLEINARGWFPASIEAVLSAQERDTDVGTIRLRGPDCSAPGVICDEVDPPGTLSVCTIIQGPWRYHQQSVAVWGKLRILDGQLWLVGENCKAPLKTPLGPVWESILWLVPPASNSADYPSFQTAKADIIRRIRARQKLTILATCAGRLETRRDIASAVSFGPDGRPQFAGFGIQGIAPAQLILGEIGDLIEGPSQ